MGEKGGERKKSNKDLTLELKHVSDPSADPAAVSEKVALFINSKSAITGLME